MQHLWFLKYIVTLFLFFNTVAFAQNNFPTGDQFWTEDGRSMLQARCMPTENSNEDIDCEMITTIFLPKAWPDELNQSLEKGLHSEIFDDKGKIKDKKQFESFCSKQVVNTMKFALGYNMGHKELDVSKEDFKKAKAQLDSNLEKLSPEEKKDKLDAMRAILTFCENGDFQSAKNIAIHEHKINEKTCSIAIRHRERVFKRINNGVFVYKSSPDMSECLVISEETIRRTGEYPWNWEIEFKRISLNPDGKTITGSSCKEIDKVPDLYKSIVETGKIYSGCSYFE